MRIRHITAAAAVLLLAAAAGCGLTGGQVGRYATQMPLTASEYTIMVNKEIALVMNLLETHMSNGRNVIRGRYPASDEAGNAEHSIVMTQEAISSVDSLYPAKGYEDDRLDTLRRMENALNSLENYLETLEHGDYEILDGLISIMQGDYVALKGMFSITWE